MNQTIYVPKVAVLLVCGASCSGKSTLSCKIIEACPRESKILFASDDIMEEYLMRHPDAAERIRRSVIENCGVLKDSGYEQFLSTMFSEALHTKDLVVSDGIYVKPEMVLSHIMASAHARGPSPFILVRMNPSREQHRKFYSERSASRKLAWAAVEQELNEFQTTLATDFSRGFPWVQQYTIENPCNVKVQFLD